MPPMKPLFLSLLVMVSGTLYGQQEGKLRLIIDPGGSYAFVLDHQFRMQQREVELVDGPHHFTFWAPQRAMVDTTILVEPGRTKDVILRLPYSAEYRAYQREVADYGKMMRTHRLLPTLVTVGSLVYTGIKWGQYRKAHDVLEDDRKAYDEALSPYRITEMKATIIPQHKAEFEKAQRSFRIAAGISLLSAGVTAYLIHRSSKRKFPEFIDQEKVRFDGLVWSPGPNGGQWLAGLTFNLHR